jgi:hypothetical protein
LLRVNPAPERAVGDQYGQGENKNRDEPAHRARQFTKDGKFLMQVGGLGKNAGSNDLENFGRVAKIWVDPKTNEAYIADGYLNRRVAVIDADTGKMKRYWGAYGNKLDDADLGNYDPKAPPAQQFRNPVHCVERSFGDGGRQPGQFYGVHSIATDSKGNIYTTETWEGKRLQKFVYKGMGTVLAGNQGVLWPKR